MKKAAFLITLILLFSFVTCSCLSGTLDKKSSFSKYLQETEDDIRKEEWVHAAESLQKSQKAWKGIKPLLQLDIDHDYVNDIETDFVKLEVYLEGKEKNEALVTILVIRRNWDNIGEM